MKNRHSSSSARAGQKVSSKFNRNDEDFFFNTERKNSIIKLRMPTVEVKDIYDIGFWGMEFTRYNESSSPLAKNAINYYNIYNNCSSNLDSAAISMTSSQTSSTRSSGSGYSGANYLSVSPVSNGCFLSDNTNGACNVFGGPYSQHMVKNNSSTSNTPRSSISKSYLSADSASILFSDNELYDNDGEPYTFKVY
jgi:hypothetical protein